MFSIGLIWFWWVLIWSTYQTLGGWSGGWHMIVLGFLEILYCFLYCFYMNSTYSFRKQLHKRILLGCFLICLIPEYEYLYSKDEICSKEHMILRGFLWFKFFSSVFILFLCDFHVDFNMIFNVGFYMILSVGFTWFLMSGFSWISLSQL